MVRGRGLLRRVRRRRRRPLRSGARLRGRKAEGARLGVALPEPAQGVPAPEVVGERGRAGVSAKVHRPLLEMAGKAIRGWGSCGRGWLIINFNCIRRWIRGGALDLLFLLFLLLLCRAANSMIKLDGGAKACDLGGMCAYASG